MCVACLCSCIGTMDQVDLPPPLRLTLVEGFPGASACQSSERGVAELHGSDAVVPAALCAAGRRLAPESGAGVAPDVAQVVAPRFARQSAELMAHARQARSDKLKLARITKAERELEEKTRELDMVSKLLPGVGVLLGKQPHPVGKRKDLAAADMCALALVCHQPLSIPMRVGMNRKRLFRVVADVVSDRQASGMDAILATSKECKESFEAQQVKGLIIATYSHQWDESRAHFRKPASMENSARRQSQQGAPLQTMVQRGSCRWFLVDHGAGKLCDHNEEWVDPPMVVNSGRSADLFAALELGMPEQYAVWDGARMGKVVEASHFFIFAPMADRASANLAILKWWGHTIENTNSEQAGSRVLYIGETCQVHSLHRAKCALPSLKRHVSKHFSLSSLMGLPTIRAHVLDNVCKTLAAKVRRVIGKAPPQTHRKWRVAFDIIYSMGATYQKRTERGPSSSFQDVEFVLSMVNNDPRQHERLEHFCQRGDDGRWCCKTQDDCVERYTTAIVNLLLGSSEQRPCESRWTNTTPSMRRTLVRRLLHNLGVCAICDASQAQQSDCVENLGVDAAAYDDYLSALNGVRAKRVKAYYAQETTFHEVTVLCMVLDATDALMFGLLGGSDRRSPPVAVDGLVGRERSLIGKTLASLRNLLLEWSAGGEERRPWMLLDLVEAPLLDPKFMLWARAQIVRMACALSRRCEGKYGNYPYCLHKLIDKGYTDVERSSVAADMLSSRRCCLDSFSYAFRTNFPTVQDALGATASAVLRAAFAIVLQSTDFCERQHAEVTASKPSRALGRDFSHFARFNLMKQMKVLHCQRGGVDPMKPRSITAPAASFTGSVMPFLAPAVEAQVALGDVARGERPALPGAPDALVPLGVLATQDKGFHRSGQGSAASGRWCEPRLLKVGASPEQVATIADEKNSEGQGERRCRRGLNPYLLFKNQKLRAAKVNAGGRTLTMQEVQ